MTSQEYKTLKASLEKGSSATEAAKSLTEPTKKIFSEGADTEDSLWKVWHDVIDVAAETSHANQQPLVEILLAVQQQNIGKDEASSERTIWGSKVKIWKDMPLLGAAAREAFNRAPGTGDKNELPAEQWSNLNAFLARLTSHSPSIPAFDFSLYAIWQLRSAFEDESGGSEADVDAAKLWFVYAKGLIEKLSKEGKSFDGNNNKIARGGDKYRDREWKGFNLERLEIWQNALKDQ
ncbi:hypothetical protein HYFRA_00006006 [Hymenoscyphus fraxineus]|uniref:Uncharacterized protein n=1 Tax=Hymenoscyphus fraxineus TaxID=746836 RepID=A0A9N9PSP5_9HELO|nr:hypothetical protein HYFRA_00006006 [Hymenoscyphus fraxineus]